MQINLVWFKPDGQRKDVPVAKSSVIGRRDDCDLRVPLVGVSRRHCELVVDSGGATVKDLASSNGTYVNGQRVSEQMLEAGDVLGVGTMVFTVQVDGQPTEIVPPETPEGLDVEDVADLELAPDDSDAFAGLVGGEDDDGEDPISALEALAEGSDDD